MRVCDNFDASLKTQVSTGMLRKLIELRKYLKSRFAWLIGLFEWRIPAGKVEFHKSPFKKIVTTLHKSTATVAAEQDFNNSRNPSRRQIQMQASKFK